MKVNIANVNVLPKFPNHLHNALTKATYRK